MDEMVEEETEATVRQITKDELQKINKCVVNFEARVNPEERFFVAQTGFVGFIEPDGFELCVEYLKVAFGPAQIDDESEVDYGDLENISTLRTSDELSAYLEGEMPDNDAKRETMCWLRKIGNLIAEPNAVLRGLRLLYAIVYKSSFEPIKCITVRRWNTFPIKYQSSLLLLEDLLTCEAERRIQRFRERQIDQMTPALPIWKNKCSLIAVMMLVRNLKIPVQHRQGTPASVAAYKEWEQMPLKQCGWTEEGWKLMLRVYGEEWKDGEGKYVEDVMKVILRKIMGPAKLFRYIKFIWNRTRIQLTTFTKVLRKKQVLIFPSLAADRLPCTLNTINGDQYLLFGLFESTMVKIEDGTERPHTFWSSCWGKFKEGGVWKIKVCQIDDHGPRKACHKLEPPPAAYGYVYNRKGEPYW